MRTLEREIARLARKSLRRILEGKDTSVTVSSENLADFSGVRKFRYGLAESQDQIGQVTGLAWTEVGGELLTIECANMPGKGNIIRPGKDVTIVAYARMANEAIIAAKELAEEGIDCEIIDPRTLQPLDTDLIIDSAKKTNRVVVAQEAVRFGGLGAEIASQIQELASLAFVL